MPTQDTPSSPRLTALHREIEAGNSAALGDFWREIEERGTPLIEPVEGDPRYALVTFLWHEKEPIENVIVAGELVGEDFAANRLQRMGSTNLWHKTYRWRSDLRTCYEMGPNDPLIPLTHENWETRNSNWSSDPLNPRLYRVNVKDEEDPKSKEKYLSVIELPDAPSQAWANSRPDGLAGTLQMHRVESKPLGGERRVWVYLPPGHPQRGGPYNLLVMTDAVPYTQIMAAPNTLDNLTLAGMLPPTVGVFVDNPNRFLDLMLNAGFASFLAEEIVPWARERFNAAPDPARTTIGGTSLGGLMSAYAAFRHPDVFGCVLSQSGAFSLSPDESHEGEEDARVEYEWMARQFVESPRLPLRFFLDVGLLETSNYPASRPSLLIANRHMRDVLQARGYEVHYLEFNGGHNYICWQGTLADGLLALI